LERTMFKGKPGPERRPNKRRLSNRRGQPVVLFEYSDHKVRNVLGARAYRLPPKPPRPGLLDALSRRGTNLRHRTSGGRHRSFPPGYGRALFLTAAYTQTLAGPSLRRGHHKGSCRPPRDWQKTSSRPSPASIRPTISDRAANRSKLSSVFLFDPPGGGRLERICNVRHRRCPARPPGADRSTKSGCGELRHLPWKRMRFLGFRRAISGTCVVGGQSPPWFHARGG